MFPLHRNSISFALYPAAGFSVTLGPCKYIACLGLGFLMYKARGWKLKVGYFSWNRLWMSQLKRGHLGNNKGERPVMGGMLVAGRIRLEAMESAGQD